MEEWKKEDVLNSYGNIENKEIKFNGNRIAGLGDRLLALIIDSIAILAIFILIGMIITSQSGGFTETGFSLEGTPAILTFIFTTFFALLYFWLLEGIFGATFGKMIIGIKVVDKSGKKCNLKSSFIRNLLRLVDGIALYLVGLFVTIFSKQRQRLGDHLANTIVIEVKQKGVVKTLAVVIWIIIVAVPLFFALRIYNQSYQATAQSELFSEDEIAYTKGELAVVNFNFLDSKNGEPVSYRTFDVNQKIFSDYEIVGYTTNEKGMYELNVNISVLDPEDILVLTPWSTNVNDYPERSDSPIKGTFNFELPDYCLTGEYKIKISVEDVVKQKSIKHFEKFSLKAEELSISEKLEIKDFYFSLSEGGSPLEEAEINSGNTIYSKCKIVGMKFEDDLINVSIDLQVIDPEGKLLIDKPNLITINDKFIYHPQTFFQNISSWVSLPLNTVKGIYKWKYILTDKLADVSTSYETTFKVR